MPSSDFSPPVVPIERPSAPAHLQLAVSFFRNGQWEIYEADPARPVTYTERFYAKIPDLQRTSSFVRSQSASPMASARRHWS